MNYFKLMSYFFIFVIEIQMDRLLCYYWVFVDLFFFIVIFFSIENKLSLLMMLNKYRK